MRKTGKLGLSDAALPYDLDGLPGRLALGLEFSQPLAANRTGATAARDVACSRRKMVEQIMKMGVLLKMVATSVRYDAPIDDVRVRNLDIPINEVTLDPTNPRIANTVAISAFDSEFAAEGQLRYS
jgi:hypothetical protein